MSKPKITKNNYDIVDEIASYGISRIMNTDECKKHSENHDCKGCKLMSVCDYCFDIKLKTEEYKDEIVSDIGN